MDAQPGGARPGDRSIQDFAVEVGAELPPRAREMVAERAWHGSSLAPRRGEDFRREPLLQSFVELFPGELEAERRSGVYGVKIAAADGEFLGNVLAVVGEQ